MKKRCSTCGRYKNISDFYTAHRQCKKCKLQAGKERSHPKNAKSTKCKLCDDKICFTEKTNYFLCEKHMRFKQMIYSAKRDKKYTPSLEQLEAINNTQKGICALCGKKMIWRPLKGKRKDQVTLQHNTDGSINFLCSSCNCKHGMSPIKDELYIIPKNKKKCNKCGKIKPTSEFNKKLNSTSGQCKICINENKKKRWRLKNPIKKPHLHNGDFYTTKELAVLSGISYNTMWQRLTKSKMSVNIAITKKCTPNGK